MGKPRPPEPPDPVETSAAQTGTNIGTTIAGNTMAMVDQNTPYGSLGYEQTGTYTYNDPFTGESYEIPTYTATQTLSPEYQQLHDTTLGAQQSLSQTAANQADFLQDYLGAGFNPEGLPEQTALPTARQGQTIDAGQYGPRTTFGPNDGYANERRRIEDAVFNRMRPNLDKERESLESTLANRGITLGSDAYSSAKADFDRGVNDARAAAVLAGGDEMSRLAGLEQAQAQFFNNALGQGFGQDLQAAGFNNNAANTMFGQEMSLAGMEDARRQQALEEQFALRNQPINEITALLSGSQVNAPQFTPYTPTPFPPTDVAGLINENYDQRLNNYNARMSNRLSTIGLLGGFFGF